MRDLNKDFTKICSATNKGVAWSRTYLRPSTVKRRGSYLFPTAVGSVLPTVNPRHCGGEKYHSLVKQCGLAGNRIKPSQLFKTTGMNSLIQQKNLKHLVKRFKCQNLTLSGQYTGYVRLNPLGETDGEHIKTTVNVNAKKNRTRHMKPVKRVTASRLSLRSIGLRHIPLLRERVSGKDAVIKGSSEATSSKLLAPKEITDRLTQKIF